MVDCGAPPTEAGYTVAAGGTTEGSTRTVSCDTGNGYSGSPPDITCEAGGSWSAYSDCTTSNGAVGMYLGRHGWMDGYFVYRRSTLKGHIASNKFYVI